MGNPLKLNPDQNPIPVPAATSASDGAFSAEDKAQYERNPWGDWCEVDLCTVMWNEERLRPGALTEATFRVSRHWDVKTGLPQFANLDIPVADQFTALTGGAGTWQAAAANPSIFSEEDSLDFLAADNVRRLAGYRATINPAAFSFATVPGDFAVQCYCCCLDVPRWVIADANRLVAWTGHFGDVMGAAPGTTKIGLLVEHRMQCRVDRASAAAPPFAPLAGSQGKFGFSCSAKFRGYGAVQGINTQDTPVNDVVPSPGLVAPPPGFVGPNPAYYPLASAFPLMGFSGFPGSNPLLDFAAGDGGTIVRVQHLIEVPATVIKDGNTIELFGNFLYGLPGVTNTAGLQACMKYKWLTSDQWPSYLTPNTGKQLTTADNDGQPRTTT